MGHKHRDKRKAVKAQLKHLHCGWHTNEYGEFIKRLSKAESRRTLLLRHQTEIAIIDRATRSAIIDLCAVEDAETFKELETLLLPASLTTGAPHDHLGPSHCR